MYNNEQVYLDALRNIKKNGFDRPERTGVGTRSLFGMQMRFDLRYSFPLLTTKKMALDSISSELLWFIEGSGDERRLAEIRYGKKRYQLENKSTIWTGNANAPYWKPLFKGDLGKVYGQMWRKWPVADGKVGLVKKKNKVAEKKFDSTQYHALDIETTSSDLPNNIYPSDNGDIKVLGKTINDDYLVEFNDGVQEVCSIKVLESGKLSNPYTKKFFGVACLGRINKEITERPYFSRAMKIWRDMITECYGKKSDMNVSKKWKCFELFINSIQNVPFFHEWVKNCSYILDVNYYGSTSYSEKTCIFTMNEVYGTPIESDNQLYESVNAVEKRTGIDSNVVISCIKSKSDFNGKSFSIYTPSKGHVVRRIKIIDQLEQLIEGIKNEPYGRRHILSAWNPSEISDMALPPCHIMSQFYVSHGELSCQLYQRSADFFLGVPFNIASYALLTHMIAQVCGLKVGDFVHTIGDAHIYQNHFDAVEEQLLRKPLSSPTIYVDPSVTDIDDFKKKSFELLLYKSHPFIKAPMAV